MAEHIDLKALERKAYTSYHNDGIVDIFLGLAILTFGILWLPMFIENTYYLWGGIFVIWVVSYAGVKRAITVPRIGYVEFKQSRQVRLIVLFSLLVVLNLVIFAIMFFSSFTPEFRIFIGIFLNQYGLFLVAVVVGGLFALFGWVTQIYRLIIYGVIALFAFTLTQIWVLQLSLPIIVLGLIITVVGFVMLYRFFKKYPISQPDEEFYDDWEDE
jgi:hypothetical protein